MHSLMRHRLLNPTVTKIARVSSIALLTMTTSAINPQLSYANSQNFFCAKSKGIPITYASAQNGRKIPILRWVNGKYFSSEWNPLTRCQQVAYRFQRSYDNGTLKTIISGTLKGEPVVCAAVSTNDTCTDNNLLFTLKRGANAKLAVQSLLDRRGLASGQIQNQSNDDTQIYVDFNTYLNNVKAEP